MGDSKPTIAELEAILDGPETEVTILPTGEIKVGDKPLREIVPEYRALLGRARDSLRVMETMCLGTCNCGGRPGGTLGDGRKGTCDKCVARQVIADIDAALP